MRYGFVHYIFHMRCLLVLLLLICFLINNLSICQKRAWSAACIPCRVRVPSLVLGLALQGDMLDAAWWHMVGSPRARTAAEVRATRLQVYRAWFSNMNVRL